MKGDRWEDPRHFRSAASFRSWLEKNHERTSELWVGFYRKGHGEGMTYPQAVDEALCFGWIDGIKRKVDEIRYTNRFTPRNPGSKWSEANLRRYDELSEEGRIARPGAVARERFDPRKHPPYSYERERARLTPAYRTLFEANREAWAFFQDQPPGYRKTCVGWIMSAKRESTRMRRLGQIIEFSAAGQRLPQISGRPAKQSPDR